MNLVETLFGSENDVGRESRLETTIGTDKIKKINKIIHS
jgi:hypothetical protein